MPRLADEDKDGNIHIWNMNSLEWIKVLKGYTGGVTTMIELADGRLASGSDDCTIHIWDVNCGKCVKVLKGHTNSVE